jgi:GNAT superfamily N-acetyltransferase
VRIHELSDPLNVASRELFEKQFGNDEDELGSRQLYLCDGAGEPVGTITAWHNAHFPDRPYGRVHWVAIVPAHQGGGLGKPLLAACLNRMVELGCRGAYLTTDPPRIPAINLYLRSGFRPHVRSERERDAWRLVADRVKEDLKATVRAGVEQRG